MAGDKGSRRFIRLWWVLAFTAGAVAGAASITLSRAAVHGLVDRRRMRHAHSGYRDL